MILCAATFVVAPRAQAQTEAAAGLASDQGRAEAALPTIVGPAPPVAPAVVSRDADGRATLRAVRLTAPLRVDGVLEESVYASVPAISDFIQNDPQAGAPATEKTEVWVFFDKDNFYVAARCWESDPSRQIANEMRRDNTSIAQNDGFAFGVDTFYDRRNSMAFEVNPLGGRIDMQVTNERQMNMDWNPVWTEKVGRFDGGWTVEVAIPFKSLRYQPGRAQVWGFNARRVNRWKNEVSYITKIPAAMTLRGHFLASLMATLVGLEAPPPARNIEIKPYVVSNLTTDLASTPRLANKAGGNIGGDAKFAISQGITGDITVNTDFAQVEADEQQVNLTRFSLFFPEKRDFFLENQGTFTFGNNSFAGGAAANSSDLPLLFYSRRIGLSGNRQVPILGGGRVTGRVGRYTVGMVNMQTRDDVAANAEATNFSVVRVKRDILRRSSIGVLGTARSQAQARPGSNEVFGVDGTFAFFNNLTFATYYAKSQTDGLADADTSYRAQMEYGGDRYGVQLERLTIDPNFSPEVGFLRRTDMRKNYAQLRFSPRSRRIRRVRKFSTIGQFTYIEDSADRISTRISDGEFGIEFQNSDKFVAGINEDYEFLLRPFTIMPGARVQAGGYEFTTGRVGYTMGQQRRLSATVLVEQGSFYNGDRTSVTINRSRINVSPRLAVEPNVVLNWFTLPTGAYSATLFGSRITQTISPLLFASALVQYNSSTHTVSANARMRWQYRPGSELFIVYNEERDSEAAIGVPGLLNRAFIIKVNRFFRF